MTGKKKYLQPKDMVLSAIHDLAALQKAKTLSSDSTRGIVKLQVSMYEEVWEYRFIVEDAGGSRSGVTIELAGETRDTKRLIDNEFALLDFILTDRARVEFEEIADEAEGF